MILVTGGAGYIGSHITARIKEKSKVVDNFSNSFPSSSSVNPIDILSHINMHGVKLVIHCAAVSDIESSLNYPWNCYETNVTGLANIIQTMKHYHVENIIFLSTGAVNASNPYSKTKFIGEEMVKSSTLNYKILRLYNVAGNVAKRKNETHLIPKAIQAIRNNTTLPIYGDSVRDYIHVEDVSEYIVYQIENIDCTTEHVGTGKGHKTSEVLETIEKITGRKIIRDILPSRPTEERELISPFRCPCIGRSVLTDIIKSSIGEL